MYDDNNIFAKIIRGEIPCKKVYEDDNFLAFYDISPKAPVHVLVIPKSAYVSLNDFAEKAENDLLAETFKVIPKIAKDLGIYEGYKVAVNVGERGGQEVPHFHVHIMGGWK